MKDKLVKFNHKKPYYVFRRFLLVALISISVISAVAIPVGISVYKDVHVQETKR